MVKKWFKLMKFSLLTMSTAAVLAACSQGQASSKPNYRKSLSWMTTSEIQTLDPSKIVDTTGSEQANNVFEGLNRLDNKGKVVPGVATKSEVSNNGLTWTFTLRKNARWSNGDPVTANDFVFALRRTADPKTASQQQNDYQAVKNDLAVVAGKKQPSALGVEAKGAHTLVVHLTHPVPYFKTLVASNWKPEDPKTVAKYGKKYGTASKYMVYNGPYVHTGWTGANLSWQLKKNKYYWDRKAVKLQTVNYSVQKTPSTDYNLYQSNKLDGAYLDTQASKQLRGQNGYRVFNLDRTEYLTYNVSKNKALANTDLRRALSLALDRKELANTVGGANTVATTFTGPQEAVEGKNFNRYFAKEKATSKYVSLNRREAKKLFRTALKQLHQNKVTLTLAGDDDDVSKKVTEFVQSQLEETFGKQFQVRVSNLPKTTRVSNMLNGKYDLDYTGLTTNYNDPFAMLNTMMTGENYNFGKWSSKQFDQAMNKSSLAKKSSERLKQLLKAEKTLDDEQPLSPLYHDGQAWMVKSNVHNLGFTGGSFNFRDTYVTK